jgi:hypothetical protein
MIDNRHTICDQLDAVVTEFEGRRKTNAGEFYSHPGRSERNGPSYDAVTELSRTLKSFADRLEALR